MLASDAGSAVVGAGRDLRCAAMAGPRPICINAQTSCCLHASQDCPRDHCGASRRSLALRWPTLRGAHEHVFTMRVLSRGEERGHCDRVESTQPLEAFL